MQEVVNIDVLGADFVIPSTPLPGDSNKVKVVLTHWIGGTLDIDLEASYDGGATWEYGGGCRGAISAEPSIEFHFTYRSNPTNIRGSFSSDELVSTNIRVISGD